MNLRGRRQTKIEGSVPPGGKQPVRRGIFLHRRPGKSAVDRETAPAAGGDRGLRRLQAVAHPSDIAGPVDANVDRRLGEVRNNVGGSAAADESDVEQHPGPFFGPGARQKQEIHQSRDGVSPGGGEVGRMGRQPLGCDLKAPEGLP